MMWGTFTEECRCVDLDHNVEEGCLRSLGGVVSDVEEVRSTCRLPVASDGEDVRGTYRLSDSREGISISSGGRRNPSS